MIQKLTPPLRRSIKGLETFEAYRDQLTPDISEDLFRKIIKEYESFFRLMLRVGGFAELKFASDTQDQNAQGLVAKVNQFQAEAANKILFFSLWWKALDDKNAQRLLDASGDYRYWLEAIRNFKDYTLSEPEEKIINIKDVTGSTALNMLYDSITNRYTFKLTVDGEEKEMTRGEISALVRDADPDLRARAYQELFRIYEADAPSSVKSIRAWLGTGATKHQLSRFNPPSPFGTWSTTS